MRSCEKRNFVDALQKTGGLSVVSGFALGILQELLDNQPTQTMPNQDQPARFQLWLSKHPREDVGSSIGKVHRSSPPPRYGSFVADRKDRDIRDIFSKPARPERLVVRLQLPGRAGIATKAVQENDVGLLLAATASNWNDLRHSCSVSSNETVAR